MSSFIYITYIGCLILSTPLPSLDLSPFTLLSGPRPVLSPLWTFSHSLPSLSSYQVVPTFRVFLLFFNPLVTVISLIRVSYRNVGEESFIGACAIYQWLYNTKEFFFYSPETSTAYRSLRKSRVSGGALPSP